MVPPSALKFGRYLLLSRIGRGGMGETWKARRLDGGAAAPVVVIKRILPFYAGDPEFVESFVNEAHVTASLQHPNIAQVLDFGQVDGEYFFAIDFVQGRTVENLIDAAASRGFPIMPVPVACFIVAELLKGLGYAHARTDAQGRPLQIVHRDISPDNVLLSFEGDVKVVDFGVAKARLRGRAETEPGMVKGKWHYFSPEQASGERLDGRSDLWAAGVVLYRMVCGRLPFEGAHVEVVHRILRGEFPPPLSLNPRLPTVLVDALGRALAVNREKRFAAAGNMETALRLVIDATAPGFDRSTLRSFIHRMLAADLAAEGIAPRIAQSDVARIEEWRKLTERARADEPTAPTAHPLPTGALSTAHAARAPRARPVRPWLWAGLVLFAVGALSAGLLATGPDAGRQQRPATARTTAYSSLSKRFQALNASRRELPHELRLRFLSLSKRSLDTDPAGELGYVEACAALEREIDALSAQRWPDEVPAEAPARPPVRPGLDQVTLDLSRGSTVRLSRRAHNLLDAAAAQVEPQAVRARRLELETSGTLLLFWTARLGGRTVWGGLPVTTSSTLELGATLQLVDFQPAFATRSEVVGLKARGGPPGQVSEPLPVSVITQEEGHFVLLGGLETRAGLRIEAARVDDELRVVVRCGEDLAVLIGSHDTTFRQGSTCGLAVAGRPGGSGGAIVTIEVER